MPVRALVAAAGLFRIQANSLRVGLARLLAAGTLERDERGEYRLGEKAQAVQHQVGAVASGAGSSAKHNGARGNTTSAHRTTSTQSGGA